MGFSRQEYWSGVPLPSPMTNLDSVLKSRNITLPRKVQIAKAMVFSNSHVWMWELDHNEGWALQNWCFRIVVLEKTLESHLDCKEIKPVNPKGNQSWIFIGRTDAEAEAPLLWPPDSKSDSLEKTLMLGKIEGRRRRGRQDEMAGWHHRRNGHEFEQTLGDGEGQGSLACCSPWGRRVGHDSALPCFWPLSVRTSCSSAWSSTTNYHSDAPGSRAWERMIWDNKEDPHPCIETHQPRWLPRLPCPTSTCLRSKKEPSEAPSSALIMPVETYPLSNSSSHKEGGIYSPLEAIWHPHCLLHLEQMPVLLWSLGHFTVPKGKTE